MLMQRKQAQLIDCGALKNWDSFRIMLVIIPPELFKKMQSFGLLYFCLIDIVVCT